MSAPAPTTPKASRNNRRNQKRTPSSKSATTDPSNQPSPATTTETKANNNDQPNVSSESAAKMKKGRSAKKNKDAANKGSPAQHAGPRHRHTSSQPSIKTPAFQTSSLYAGPTFHASPAPSALPIPSFFSKSVPETDFPTSGDLNDDSPGSDPGETTPTKSSNTPAQQDAGTASPLDFLFNAARQARSTKSLSELENSSPLNTSTPPQPRNAVRNEGQTGGGMFPLELEGSDTRASPIGPSFATSYRDRMNALRTANLGSYESLDNKAKSEALKKLLLNPTPQRASSASSRLTGQSQSPSNIFKSSGDYPMYNQPFRHASDPTCPIPFSHAGKPPGTQNEIRPALAVMPQHAPSSVQPHRAPSSGLRTMISPTSPVTPPRQQSMGYTQLASAPPANSSYHGSAGGFVSPTPHRGPPSFSTPQTTNAPPPRLDAVETKRMEDDLRRILKLNPGDGRSPKDMGKGRN